MLFLEKDRATVSFGDKKYSFVLQDRKWQFKSKYDEHLPLVVEILEERTQYKVKNYRHDTGRTTEETTRAREEGR